ncbi:MAG: hypothetical protein ACTHME_05055 [Candidatus Nitrosocosmicus sp.]
MEIRDNLELHSHYIEQLFESDKILRERTHAMSQKIGIQTHILSEDSKNILNLVEHAKITSEEIRKLKSEHEKHKSLMTFIRELFDRPIHWVYIFLLLMLIESIKGFDIPSIIKHFI